MGALPSVSDNEAEAAAVESAVLKERERWGPPPVLPPHEDNPNCPKCGNLAVTISYHGFGGHRDCPDGGYRTIPPGFWDTTDPTMQARVIVATERMVEHMDRKCQNCGYGWVTDVAKAAG